MLKSRIQYRLTQLFARRFAKYVAILVAFLGVTLMGMNAYFAGLFSDQSIQAEGIHGNVDRGLWDSLWWSLKHVLDPGQFAEDYGAGWPVLFVSLFLSIAGLALLGTFIATISSTIQQSFDSLRRGNSPVIEQGHTLILGWNQNVVGILRYLADVGFKKRIVILAPQDILEMQEVIHAGRNLRGMLDIILRSGNTGDVQELSRVALGHADCIISVAHDHSGSDQPDISSIKTLMLLNAHQWPGPRPRMVAEVTERQNAEIADIAGGRQIPIVSSGDIISRVLVQCARYPGLSGVISELFSPQGNLFVVRGYAEFDGATFSDISHSFPAAIPIGVTWPVTTSHGERMACALNVEPEYDLASDEKLVLIAKETQPLVDHSANRQPPVAVSQPPPKHKLVQNLAIIGWNRNIDEILEEFDGHAARGARITIVARLAEKDVHDKLQQIRQSLHNLELDYRCGDTVDRQTLTTLNPWQYDRLMLLADHSSHPTDPDSSTIMTALVLTDMQRATGRPLPHAIIELEDGANRKLLDNMFASDIIVTPELISQHLGLISQQQVLGAICKEILSAGGMEIALRPATDYIKEGQNVSFAELTAATQHYAEIALGVHIRTSGFTLNPAKETQWSLSADDQIIVLAQQVYD